jgi:FKBP-type peptidyl-prolyl cis-trans isomerase SlyD
MQISINKVVSLKYRLSNAQNQEQIEETNETNPLVFLFGFGTMIPDFEDNLSGKISGDTFDFRIDAEKAYGNHDPQHIAMIPSNIFYDENGNFDDVMFQVGSVVPMSDSDGNHLRGTIMEVTEEHVKMDFNHPLAGTDLHFTGVILDVREATEDEIAHGHVHGEHGHQY